MTTRPLLPHDLLQLEGLGLRMRLARERRGISDALMAERIGVSLETLQSMENGSASISLADFYRALRILGLSRDLEKIAVDEDFAGKVLSIKERLERAVQLYAKRYRPDATGVIVHSYPEGKAYEIEVLAGDGSTIAVQTVSQAELLSIKERE